MHVVKPTYLGSSEGEKSMLVENLLRRMFCAATLAGTVALMVAGPASAVVIGGVTGAAPAMIQFGSQLCAGWTDTSHHLNVACGDPTQGGFQAVTFNQS